MRALIISADQFEDSELLAPLQMLEEADIEVDIASLRKGPITGKHGGQVTANLALTEVLPDAYGLLLLPGGKAPAQLCEDFAAVAVSRHFLDENKLVAAICHGPLILVATGLMRGRTATAYGALAWDLTRAGARYLDEAVVVDGNLITSREPADLPAFQREIFARIQTPGAR